MPQKYFSSAGFSARLDGLLATLALFKTSPPHETQRIAAGCAFRKSVPSYSSRVVPVRAAADLFSNQTLHTRLVVFVQDSLLGSKISSLKPSEGSLKTQTISYSKTYLPSVKLTMLTKGVKNGFIP
jgi:hypothetical protein